MKTARLST